MTAIPEVRNFAGAEPVLRYLFPVKPDASTLGKWQRTFDYDVWTHCSTDGNDPHTLWEKVEGGVVRIPKHESTLHVVKAGTPHHVAGLFGYWRTSDSDIIFFRVVREGVVHEAMVLGGCPSAYEQDSISWICPSCATEFGKVTVSTGRKNISRFWAEEVKAVARFNSAESQRTCPVCARVHPLAYEFKRPGMPDAHPELDW